MEESDALTTQTRCPKLFEVGRFYLVHVSIWTNKKIPALCVKKSRCRIHFEYLSREMDGSLCKFVCWRSLGHTARGNGDEIAYSNERFSTIMSVRPDDIADKPKMWDGIPSNFKGGRRSRTKKQSAQTAKELPACPVIKT